MIIIVLYKLYLSILSVTLFVTRKASTTTCVQLFIIEFINHIIHIHCSDLLNLEPHSTPTIHVNDFHDFPNLTPFLCT